MSNNYVLKQQINKEYSTGSKKTNNSVIHFSKEPVRYICDKAFNAVKPKYFPEELNPVLAAVYGLDAGDVAANYCKDVVYPQIVKPVAENIGVNFSLKHAAYAGLILVGGVLLKRALNPKKTIQYIKDHPDMSTGAVAVMASASRVAVKTIKEERQKEFLQNNYSIKS